MDKILTHEEVTGLVREYQGGSTDAMATLLAAFSSYFTKWHTLLRGDWVNVLDPEIASFASMFRVESVSDLAGALRKATAGMTSEDIMHEIMVTFMELASKYRDVGSGFTAYLTSSMKYRLYRWVIAACEVPLVRYEESVEDAPSKPEGVPDTVLLTDPDLLPGITPQMRTILYMRYVTGMSVADIAESLCVSPAVVRSRIAAAREILKSSRHSEALRLVNPGEYAILDEGESLPSSKG